MIQPRFFGVKKVFGVFLTVIFLACLSLAADTAERQADLAKRLAASTKVLNEVMSSPDKSIPRGVIQRARCVAVFPSTVQVAVLVGAKHGSGFATCRTSNGWSAPAPLDISGGSWGAQLGGEEVDLVMVVTDDKGMQQLEAGKFDLGTETSVTAGPVGNHDMKMNSDVLTYSRARGVFAGTNFNGSSISEEESATRALYGRSLSLADIFGGKVPPPEDSKAFLSAVQGYAGRTRQKD